MAKRSIGAAIILAALLLVCSCDPESFLRSFGTNVLGGTVGKETVEEITAMIDGSETTYDELVKLVVQATRNSDTEKALIDSLSKDATEESVNGVRQQVSQVAAQLEQVKDDALSDLPPTIQKEANKAIDAIEKIQAEGLGTHIPLTRAMFETAFEKIPPSISAELLWQYENFRK